MSYTDKKITQEEINAHHVQGATDHLIGNAQQNKAVFDDLPEFIAGKHNELIDELNSHHGDEIKVAVDEWLAEHPEVTTTVQDNSLTTAKYVDGSVTEPKIAEGAVTPSKLDRAYSTPADLASVNANLTNELNVLDARMDEFASLPEGSTSGNAELVDIRVGVDGKTYQSAGGAVRGQVGDLKSDINELGSFDDYITNVGCEYLTERTDGKLYWVSSGKVVQGDNNNTATYPPFKIRKGKTYYFNNLYAYFCFIVDESGTATRLSENTSNFVNGTYTATSNATVYVTINTGASVVFSFRSTIYRPANATGGIYSVGLSIDGYTHISIKTDGTGDYTNPVSAVRDIKDSSEKNQYMLDIYEGIYNIWTMLNAEEKQGSIWGLTLPDYVHMRGIGNRDNIILTCINANPASTTEVEYTSCLNLKQNNNLENLTFTARNARYVVHDESSNTYKNWHRNVKNCRFLHYGNDEGYWAYTDAWGEGCSSGSYSYFENCIFENYSYVPPFKFHTNTNFEASCTHIFKNCQFIQHYIGADSSGAFGIVDIQSGKPINVEFIGCTFSSFIFVENYQSTTDIEELNITGHGNSPVFVYPYRPNVSSPKKIFAKFSDEVAMVYNPYDAIAAGRPLRYTSYTRNNVAVVQSDGTQCAGIALDTIPAQGIGYMKYAGILDLSTVGVSGINIGDKVGVASWSVAKVTDGTEFARAIQNSVIKFL